MGKQLSSTELSDQPESEIPLRNLENPIRAASERVSRPVFMTLMAAVKLCYAITPLKASACVGTQATHSRFRFQEQKEELEQRTFCMWLHIFLLQLRGQLNRVCMK